MSSDPGWWARALGNDAPVARQAPPPPQHQGYPPQQVPPFQQQYPAQQYPAQQYPQQPPHFSERITSVDQAVEGMKVWQGGEGTFTETNRCPNCGGNHYFSRAEKNSRMPPPAPLCYSCGYTGMFTQADSSNWSAA